MRPHDGAEEAAVAARQRQQRERAVFEETLPRHVAVVALGLHHRGDGRLLRFEPAGAYAEFRADRRVRAVRRDQQLGGDSVSPARSFTPVEFASTDSMLPVTSAMSFCRLMAAHNTATDGLTSMIQPSSAAVHFRREEFDVPRAALFARVHAT